MKTIKTALTRFSLKLPWLVVAATVVMTGFFTVQFPKVHFDNDPENMLAKNEYVRTFHHEVKETFALYDFVIAGIVNENDPDGVFNPETLQRIDHLTKQLSSLHRDENGMPAIRENGQSIPLDLEPKDAKTRTLAKFFKHDVNRLFDEEGNSAIINREIISPSVVDNIKQAEKGQLRIEYLMEEPPTTREEAQEIRRDAMSNPLYRDTLVSEDGKALCLYLPITEKTFSYNVANLVKVLTENWEGHDEVYITGLPVAEDTFGVEMLVQMATSAPMAGLAIFILLFVFFRKMSLITAPMLLAIVTVLSTMGLLIGLGFDVHIMSSMIAIFLMPIAVADSVHLLSEFYDTYPKIRDKKKTVIHVVEHLFSPMLYTSLTTMAGFASLALTPIPPVKVFGLHIAFGVGLAWLLTMTFIPAYLMLFVSSRSLEKIQAPAENAAPRGGLAKGLAAFGQIGRKRARLVLVLTGMVLAVAAYGISQINVNDNPVKWFTKSHRIRVADDVLNHHFGGTYTAYLELESASEPGAVTLEQLRNALNTVLPQDEPDLADGLLDGVDLSEGLEAALETVKAQAAAIDETRGAGWLEFGDAVAYEDPATFSAERLAALANEHLGEAGVRFMDQASKLEAASGEDLQNAVLDLIDELAPEQVVDLVFKAETELTAPVFKRPEVLRWVAGLQEGLLEDPRVGKSSSAVDALKKANYELNFSEHASPDENRAFFAVPDTVAGTAQVFTQLEGMKKKDSLFHLVTRDYNKAVIWVQLTSGDNQDMGRVVEDVEVYFRSNPPPADLEPGWAGLTYINVVWQEKMVLGMLSALGSSFVVVLIMMMILFRSFLFGLLSMIPLSITISFTYGLIGLAGKDYDMPVAVLSALTLGLSVDFAIHFLQRSREIRKKHDNWKSAITEVFSEPAMAISRNAIVISIGFTPLLFAPLVPYKTVGFFLATIMAVSWLATLMILTALATVLQKKLYGKGPAN